MSELWVYSLGLALGSNVIDVAELLEEHGPVREGFAERTGFSKLYAADEAETSLSLGVRAAGGGDSQWWTEFADGLIFVGSTGDLMAPGNAHLLQGKLGLRPDLFVLDINDACTGFVRALALANSLIGTNAVHTVLVVLSDTYTKLYAPSELKVSPLFSDGASALLISDSRLINAPQEVPARRWEILSQTFLSEGGHANELCITRIPGGAGPGHLTMNGGAVFNFVLRSLGKSLENLAVGSDVATQDVDSWYVHQGSRAVVNAVEKTLGVPTNELFRANEYGNVVGSSIPFQIYEDVVTTESTIGLLAFGVGLTIGGVLLRQRPLEA